ncbi:uncharacterized protein BYT42DRAFT_99979 [Radiomyces spectabilis]|uniref:uncharacterized protein n=1 Tax=Radiomyces spectabilis TaxID=64574 RepID=UPI00221F6D9A|nr:uncharacterized protein BYT42DRAFT_99979 [Radiomyces spectabilis]KAI8370711.1 hypothetical protein BYT42DRAFT_99979 [Radiomyces spectabilis]
MIAASHLKCILAEDYTETNSDIASVDWTWRLWMRVICARAMEGLVLSNGSKGLLVNCAEVYGRSPTLAHHERTKIKPSVQYHLTSSHRKYANVDLFVVKEDKHYQA